MELEILHTSGVPKNGIISIRAGSTRRQAQISSLDHPIKFPSWPQDSTTFKVDVLSLCATARLAYSPTEDIYSLPLVLCHDAASGGCADPNMEIAFAVRKAASSGSLAKEAGMKVVPENPDAEASFDSTAAWKQRRESAAKEYLEEHGVLQFLQFVMQSLMKEKPSNPWDFIRKHADLKEQKHGPYKGAEKSVGGPRDACYARDAAQLGGDLDVQAQALEKLMTRVASGDESVPEDAVAALTRQASETADRLRADNHRLRDTASNMKTQVDSLAQESSRLQLRQAAMLAEQTRKRRALAGTLAVKPFRQFYRDNFLRECGKAHFRQIYSNFPSRAVASQCGSPKSLRAVEETTMHSPSNGLQRAFTSPVHGKSGARHGTDGFSEPGSPIAAQRRATQMAAFKEIARMQEEIALLAHENEALVKELSQARVLMDELGDETHKMRDEVSKFENLREDG